MSKNSKEQSFIQYVISLGDHSLILGHRNSEWCGHGPILEQDIAITNISLDLIGQARNFYQYAASLSGDDVTEDTLAYLRSAGEFRNCVIFELPKEDWAFTITRQFLFSSFQFLFFQQLEKSSDEQLAAIATKSLKEVTYHLRWSSEWVIRLGDGTEESHARMENAVQQLWPYVFELFDETDFEKAVIKENIGVDTKKIKQDWEKKVDVIFSEATLTIPTPVENKFHGKSGNHTAELDAILKDLQHLQRTYPGAEW